MTSGGQFSRVADSRNCSVQRPWRLPGHVEAVRAPRSFRLRGGSFVASHGGIRLPTWSWDTPRHHEVHPGPVGCARITGRAEGIPAGQRHRCARITGRGMPELGASPGLKDRGADRVVVGGPNRRARPPMRTAAFLARRLPPARRAVRISGRASGGMTESDRRPGGPTAGTPGDPLNGWTRRRTRRGGDHVGQKLPRQPIHIGHTPAGRRA